MERYEIERELDSLYKDFQTAHNSDEQTVRRLFNADSKLEAVKVITDEIDRYESELEELLRTEDDDIETERTSLCMSLGISRYC